MGFDTFVPVVLSLSCFDVRICHCLVFIIIKSSNWQQRVEKAFLPLSVLLSVLCFCEPRAWSSQSLSWERLKDWNYIALMVDYFELPKRVAEGRRQVLVTRSYLEQENPSRPSTSGAFNFLQLKHFVILTRRGVEECCVPHRQVSVSALPDSSQVCFVRVCVRLDF